MTSSTNSDTNQPSANALKSLHQHLVKLPIAQSLLGEQLELADYLFSKAPEDYLIQTSVSTLAEVCAEANSAYRAFLKSDKQFFTTAYNHPSSSQRKGISSFISIIVDRSFIIDTISELFRVNALEHRLMLHPILRAADGRKISLVYVELDKIEDSKELESLAKRFELAFADLVKVTDDFTHTLVNVETSARVIETSRFSSDIKEAEIQEAAAFLRWLADGGFVFLGSQQWSASSKISTIDKKWDLILKENSSLGLFNSADSTYLDALKDVSRDIRYLLHSEELLYFSKLFLESPIHRRVNMDIVILKIPSVDNSSASLLCLIGLFTSKALSQEASSIPMIRRKLQKILELEGLPPNCYDYKEVLSIANNLPKSELLSHPVDILLAEIKSILGIQRRNEIRLNVHISPLHRFISFNIAMPRERLSADAKNRIQYKLENLLGAPDKSAEYRLSSAEDPVSIMHFLVPNPSLADIELDLEKLELEIDELSLTWNDLLYANLRSTSGSSIAQQLVEFYSKVLPDQYKAITSTHEACADIAKLEALANDNVLEISIKPESETLNDVYILKLYKLGEIFTLSSILPLLENMGFDILHESITSLQVKNTVWATIYDFRVKFSAALLSSFSHHNPVLLEGMKNVLLKKVDNDPLNALLVSPGLSSQQIAILRTITQYIWQIKLFSTVDVIQHSLTTNPQVTKALIDCFEIKFDPQGIDSSAENRQLRFERATSIFYAKLKSVSRLVEDRVLRAVFNIIVATVRTNAFQCHKDYRISLKIDCAKVPGIPKPVPTFEIFACSPKFEGIHLRSGLVARGGLRWSDRNEDFRTEVLGLMKTQTVKNAIIIPTGAKGGFILKHRPSNPKQLRDEVEACYRLFIISLLEITDNRINGNIVSPKDVVIYDKEDPYLVVAADRGTAAFSDIANDIAINQFQFWLGDAFASGGSCGYDHKKLGITAKGAWQAVYRHFTEIGLDPAVNTFSVVGIGDMSGDVFGNGMLESTNIKLIAAFDHRHIFVDPDPDPKISFLERKRLFDLPSSSWADYDASLISPGGGVFSRADKEISLSNELRSALSIEAETVSADDLIKSILRAHVDLLWNGGIGTFVKSSEEDNLSVGDKTNDDIRVNGRDLRARVIGEGGNLGFTQRARIEYSKIGGHINLDAIDNSGGVSTSDYEVNIKLLLSEPMLRGELSFEQRNSLLMACGDEICKKVISQNKFQCRKISLAVKRSRKNLDYYKALVEALEASGFLNRNEEFLPDNEIFEKRAALKAGLTRPELGVLIGYSKLALTKTILKSDVPEDPYTERPLISYFPSSLQQQFLDDIRKHPLRREIIATQLVSKLIDRMGSTYILHLTTETGVSEAAAIKAFIIADAIIDSDSLVKELSELDHPSTMRIFLDSLLRLSSATDSVIRRILDTDFQKANISNSISTYQTAIAKLSANLESFIPHIELTRFKEVCRQQTAEGMPEDLANRLLQVNYFTAFIDIAEISIDLDHDLIDVAKLYASISSSLQIRELLKKISEYEPADRWEGTAISSLQLELRRTVGDLSEAIIKETKNSSEQSLNIYFDKRTAALNRYENSLKELHNSPTTIAALFVVSKLLRGLSE